MNCPKCDAVIAADNVNIQALIAKCEKCNEVFRVADVLPAASSESADPPEAVRFPRPATLTVIDEGDIRVIRRRWFRPVYLFLLFFCIAWDSFLFFWYSMALFGPNMGGVDVLFMVFPIAHVAVGVGLTYFVIAGFLNKTYLGVTPEALFIRHRPVPWPGNRNLASADVKEVFVEKTITQHRHGRTVTQYYSVLAVTADGARVKLLGSLELAEAQFYTQQLNDWLNLRPSRLGIPLTKTA